MVSAAADTNMSRCPGMGEVNETADRYQVVGPIPALFNSTRFRPGP
jgi:hypothetical protein